MGALAYKVPSTSDGYSAKCIAGLPDLDSQILAEEILDVLQSFSNRLPPIARSSETPVDRLGEALCGRIVYKVMHGRPLTAAAKYEATNVKFEGMALGVVAAIASGGLGSWEMPLAERSIRFLIELMEGKNAKLYPFSRKRIDRRVDRFFKKHAGANYDYTGGVALGLKYVARKSGDQVTIFSLEAIEEEFYKVL